MASMYAPSSGSKTGFVLLIPTPLFVWFSNTFEKIKSGEEKLEEARKLQNIFKSNLSETVRGRYKSWNQDKTFENIKLLYKAQQTIFNLFNNYSTIASEAKYKAIHGKGRPSDLATRLKILTPKQILQRLPILRIWKIKEMKSIKSYILCTKKTTKWFQ